MAPPVKITPPSTLPSDFDKWDQHGGAPNVLPANFDRFDSGPANGTNLNHAPDWRDTITNFEPHAMPHSMGELGQEFGKAFRNVGGGFAAPFLHPIDTVKSAMDVGLHAATGNDPALANDFQPLVQSLMTNPLETIESGLGSAVATEGMRSFGAPLARSLKSGAGTINDALIGAPAGKLRYGAEPGLEMAKRGIVGSSPATLAARFHDVIPDVAAEHRGIVAASPTGASINTGPIIAPAFDDLIVKGTDPRTGAAAPTQIRAAARVRDQLTHVPDTQTGQITPAMRDPNITPLEATDLKSNIYGRTNYENPDRYALANTGLKTAAHGLKSAVEQTVPESVESGQSLHNLMAAKDIVEPSARSQRIPTSKSGIVDRLAMGAGTRLAREIYRGGNAAEGLSPSLQYAFPAVWAATQKKEQ